MSRIIKDRSGDESLTGNRMRSRVLMRCAVLALMLTGICTPRADAFQLPVGDPPTVSGVQGGEQEMPYYLRDRGRGIPVSMFGTYIRRGELLFYPYFEYYHDRDTEYAPDEFGYADTDDYFGNFIAREWLVWVGYGFSDRFAAEFEVAYLINATMDSDPDDLSGMPPSIHESGLGDVEGQLRYRWTTEDEKKPEIFSYYETVFPFQKDKQIIGTPVWELKLGTGVVKGFRWGTVTARAAVEYSEDTLDIGEVAVEYLKRVSSRLRLFGSVEGTQDEWEFITEAQLFITPNIFIKLNNAFGLTSKATNWAPEIGVMFSMPPR